MSKQLTLEEQMDRWEWQREIQNLMGKYSAAYVVQRQYTLYEKYWSKRPDVSLGTNEGWYQGADAVQSYYDGLRRQTQLVTDLIRRKYPQHLGQKSPEELFGVGMMDYKPLDTCVLEIAGDCATAKGLWSLRGTNANYTTSGPVGYWEWGWMAADFVREADGWKIWHLLYLRDIYSPCGQNWTEPPKTWPPVPGFEELASFDFPRPNVPCCLRPLYHKDRPYMPGPPVPFPYETFSETFSYGPEQEVDHHAG